jgi:hypothetical protein
VRGYALSVAASLVVLALELAVVDALQQDRWNDFFDVLSVVLVLGAVPAAILGAAGTSLVHVLTRWTTVQVWHVAAAAGAGLAAGLVLYGDDLGVPLLLASATGVGRLSVVPLTRRDRTPARPST